jgi:hypothetical protein
MKRGDYVRLTVYLIPPGLQAPSLSVLVLISDQVSLMEGWLSASVLVGGKIHLAARIKEGESVQGTYTSEPILAIQGPYVHTPRLIYHVFKVPSSRPEDDPGSVITSPRSSKATGARQPVPRSTRFLLERGQFIRVTAFALPYVRQAPDLSDLASTGIPLWVVDGWLLHHLEIGKRMRMIVIIHEGKSCRKRLSSTRIFRVQQNGYVLTKATLYQFVRVPPPEGETFAEFA